MNKALLAVLAACLAWAASTATASSLKPLTIGVRTTDCRGQNGYANIEIDRITRLQSYTCPESSRALTQLLARPAEAGAGLEAYMLTDEEAARVQGEIERLRALRQRALEQGKTIILEH